MLTRSVLGATTALAAVVIVAGCGSESSAPTTSGVATAPGVATGAGDAAAARIALTPALDHVHGLHVDADGTVLAGTHSGLRAIDAAGMTTPVGATDDDLMGFSGAPGTDMLVTSGHPGPSSTDPNPLGLRRSDDGGQTWTNKSLLGEVDFHALATDGTVVVGFDGTTGLRVSTDGGATWSPGATVAAASLALTSTGVWALTPAGLQHSTDQGRSFVTVENAPALVMVAGSTEAVWGIGADGFAWRSRDGNSWEKRSFVGTAEALAVAGFDTAYAATAETLFKLS
ncbi:F510_1955 family glycosylhydrolase [Gordonia rhizosphera]|uniref:Glycosyl hydrolase n=1 Tax=Gordonia rhizosphera NBRC 16068 TaxID=1108045 RepID=K6W969_9ACTN|nr:hypothetical protein [Gordonia rhizosphera]GAB88752.1 hypothetical protein GORHZ_038_00230 [Gordonia rhizosphera NBRC 16068]